MAQGTSTCWANLTHRRSKSTQSSSRIGSRRGVLIAGGVVTGRGGSSRSAGSCSAAGVEGPEIDARPVASAQSLPGPACPRRVAVLAVSSAAMVADPKLVELLRVVSVHLSAAARARHGLRVSDMRALVCLSSQRLSAGTLANKLGLSRSATSALLDRMEADELIRRETDRSDGRRILVGITEEGRRLARADDASQSAQRIDEVLGRLTAADRRVVERFMSDLAETLGERPGAADPRVPPMS
jgi:DNA-binding MarR family transcriptional regulator